MCDDFQEILKIIIGELKVHLPIVRHIHQVHRHGLIQMLPDKCIDLQQKHILFFFSLNFFNTLEKQEHVDNVWLLNCLHVFDGQLVDEIVDERQTDRDGG